MIFRKSLKQLLRTPLTTALFIVLFAIAAFFICTGAVIWARNQAAIKTYEHTFITIGTVHQRPTAMNLSEEWDAFQKDYSRWSEAAYASIIPPSALKFDGANYILGPEKRPFYGAWCPDLKLWPENTNKRILPSDVVEVTPLQDFVPDQPGQVRIEKVLSGTSAISLTQLKQGDVIWLCDHYNDAPKPLYAGKTYVSSLASKGPFDPSNLNGPLEYTPWTANLDFSTQYRPDGTLVKSKIILPAIQEVTDGFFETEAGRLWMNYAGAVYDAYSTVPVLPTNGTQLLLPFYNGTAAIAEGQDITPEEYANGERVCLVSQNFADMNGLSVGDQLRLPLYYADYKNTPSHNFPEVDHTSTMGGTFTWGIGAPLNAGGEPYSVFSDHEYTVKGIYSSTPGSDSAVSMGANTVVIPASSVRESDADNILDYGPMTDTTTAFQIPNGSIETFMENYLKRGNDVLDFTFYDHGYTQLHRGLENMKHISTLFLAIGAAMSLALVFFFCNLFITKNKMRTAVERMLGYSKKQCAVSLLSGFLLAAVIAAATGCAAGFAAEGYLTSRLTSQEYYNTSYTFGPLGSAAAMPEENASALYSPAAALALVLVTALISSAFMRGNVKEEPLKLLGGRRE